MSSQPPPDPSVRGSTTLATTPVPRRRRIAVPASSLTNTVVRLTSPPPGRASSHAPALRRVRAGLPDLGAKCYHLVRMTSAARVIFLATRAAKAATVVHLAAEGGRPW